MFKSCGNQGFHITFANDVTISVQFGPHNLCERRTPDRFQPKEAPEKEEQWESSDAEVAIFLPDGKLYQVTNNNVIGWQTAEDVAKLIEVARKL